MCFYAVGAVGENTLRDFLQQAYRLGHEFQSSLAPVRERTLEPATVEGGVR